MAGNKRERELARARAARKEEAERKRRLRRRNIAAGAVALVAVVALVGGAVIAAGGDDEPTASAPSTSPSPTETAERTSIPAAKPVVDSCRRTSGKGALTTTYDEYTGSAQDGTTYTLGLKTNCGPIEIRLDPGAPETIKALTFLADRQYFDGSVCHRLTTDGIYVLQCGDPTATGAGSPGFVVPDENLPGAGEDGRALYPRGTVAMANSGPGTVGSQFFLVHEDTYLDPLYTVAGKVTKGMDVLDAVADAGTADGRPDGPPKQVVEIQEAKSSATRKVTT